MTPARLPAVVVAMLALVTVGLCVVVDLVNEPADRAQAIVGWGSVSACIGAIAVATQESAPEDLRLSAACRTHGSAEIRAHGPHITPAG